MKSKRNIICILAFMLILLIISYFNINKINDCLTNFAYSFNRTLIVEDRYLLILKGLKATLFISMFSIMIGSLVGVIICWLRKSRFKVCSNLVKFLIHLIQGTPITVLLLIFYYVIFGSIDIDPIIVAIMTFSIYFSVYCAEIYRGAINSINKSQIVSAYSLGFSRIQAFVYIILPQILSVIIPVFKNECVSLIKLTSIAGYISIIDLTKASDIIRNRTYEAFFPLIFTAIIYYLICFGVEKGLNLIYKKINPREAGLEK